MDLDKKKSPPDEQIIFCTYFGAAFILVGVICVWHTLSCLNFCVLKDILRTTYKSPYDEQFAMICVPSLSFQMYLLMCLHRRLCNDAISEHSIRHAQTFDQNSKVVTCPIWLLSFDEIFTIYWVEIGLNSVNCKNFVKWK